MGSPLQFWQGNALNIGLVANNGSGSGAECQTQRARWTSAKEADCAAGQPEPPCVEMHLVPLSDVSPVGDETGGAIAAAGGAHAAVRRAAVKPSPALQAYLGSLPATEDAGTVDAAPKMPAIKAAVGSGNLRLQHAALTGANPPSSKGPYNQWSALTMTKEVQQGPAYAGVMRTAIARPDPSAPPTAARACAKPTFASTRKLPGSMAGTAAHAKAPVQNRPKTKTCAKRPAAGKAVNPTDATTAQQQMLASAGMAPSAQALAREGGGTAEAAATKAPPRKRTKAEDLDSAQVEAKVRDKHTAGQLEKLSIPELKCFLKARKQALGGKKADLVARVTDVLASTS